MKIKQASLINLEQLIPLFDGYRTFYKQPSDIKAVKEFLMERFNKNDSVIFMAFDDEDLTIGFTQLYPSFSSVSMKKYYILNDLYVNSNLRGKGIGKALLKSAKQFAINNKCKGLRLETDIENPAQKLYERMDWKKDTEVIHYTWNI